MEHTDTNVSNLMEQSIGLKGLTKIIRHPLMITLFTVPEHQSFSAAFIKKIKKVKDMKSLLKKEVYFYVKFICVQSPKGEYNK